MSDQYQIIQKQKFLIKQPIHIKFVSRHILFLSMSHNSNHIFPKKHQNKL